MSNEVNNIDGVMDSLLQLPPIVPMITQPEFSPNEVNPVDLDSVFNGEITMCDRHSFTCSFHGCKVNTGCAKLCNNDLCMRSVHVACCNILLLRHHLPKLPSTMVVCTKVLL